MKNKKFARSRKAVLMFLILIFLISVASFHFRRIQRIRNYNEIKQIVVHTSYYDAVINEVKENSRISNIEDMLFFGVTNIISFFLFIALDNIGLFEKTSETYHKNIDRIKRKFRRNKAV